LKTRRCKPSRDDCFRLRASINWRESTAKVSRRYRRARSASSGALTAVFSSLRNIRRKSDHSNFPRLSTLKDEFALKDSALSLFRTAFCEPRVGLNRHRTLSRLRLCRLRERNAATPASSEIFPRDLRKKEKVIKIFTGPLYFSPKCRKYVYRLYHNTRDCTIPDYYRRCARLLTRLAGSPRCQEG
uniref:ALK and LTK ligand 2a n=1 Tax=Cyprinus carpio carpio TaxID=630221 RepID=A0A9J8BE37_CYPCA